MPNIYIKVKNKVTYADKDQVIVGGNKDYKAIFEFDNEWNEILTKTARFSWSDKMHDEIFTGNECDIPRITNTNSLKVGIFIGNEKATTDVIIPCKISTVNNNGMPPNPEDDVYTQILKKLDQAIGEQTAVPEGGKKGQFLGKASDEDYDTKWQDVNTLTQTDKEKLEVIKTEGSENKFLNEEGNYVEIDTLTQEQKDKIEVIKTNENENVFLNGKGEYVEVPKDEGSGIRTLETAPTTSTEGYVGEIVQVKDGTAYQCTAITDGAYTWVKLMKYNDFGFGFSKDATTGNYYINTANGSNYFDTYSSLRVRSNVYINNSYFRYGVKRALTNPEWLSSEPSNLANGRWTEEDRAMARATLGITGGGGLYKHTLTFTFINNPDWIPLVIEAISTSSEPISYSSNGVFTNFDNVLGIVTSKQITYATGSAIQPLALLDVGMFVGLLSGQLYSELVDGYTCSLVDIVTEL